jgi:hypothetical protein
LSDLLKNVIIISNSTQTMSIDLQAILDGFNQSQPMGERLRFMRRDQLQNLQKQIDYEMKLANTAVMPHHRLENLQNLRRLLIEMEHDLLMGHLAQTTEALRQGRTVNPPEEAATLAIARGTQPRESLGVFASTPTQHITPPAPIELRPTSTTETSTDSGPSSFDEFCKSKGIDQGTVDNFWNKITIGIEYFVYSFFGKKRKKGSRNNERKEQREQQSQSTQTTQGARPERTGAMPGNPPPPVGGAGSKPPESQDAGTGSKPPEQTRPERKPPERTGAMPGNPPPPVGGAGSKPPESQDAGTGSKPPEHPSQPGNPDRPLRQDTESEKPPVNIFDKSIERKDLLGREFQGRTFEVDRHLVSFTPDSSFINIDGVRYAFLPSAMQSVVLRGGGQKTFADVKKITESLTLSMEGGNFVLRWEALGQKGSDVYSQAAFRAIIAEVAKHKETGKPFTVKSTCRKFDGNNAPKKTGWLGTGSLDHETEYQLVAMK